MQVLEHFRKYKKPKSDQITIGFRYFKCGPCVTIYFNKASMMRLFKVEIEVGKVEAVVSIGDDLGQGRLSLQLVKAGEQKDAIPFEMWRGRLVCLNLEPWFNTKETTIRAEALNVVEQNTQLFLLCELPIWAASNKR